MRRMSRWILQRRCRITSSIWISTRNSWPRWAKTNIILFIFSSLRKIVSRKFRWTKLRRVYRPWTRYKISCSENVNPNRKPIAAWNVPISIASILRTTTRFHWWSRKVRVLSSFTSFPCNFQRPLVVTRNEIPPIRYIVILRNRLLYQAKQILFQEKDLGNVSLYVSWNIWNQETAYTPTLKCPKLNFNSSFVYRIPDLFSFFNYILLEFVIFQVNVYQEDNKSFIVARGKLCIKDILDYPQNKLHYIAPVNSVMPCTVGMNFGQLSLWVRLSCDIEKVEAFKKRRGIVDVEKPKKELEPKIVPKEEIVMEPKKVTTSEEEPEVFHYESSTEIDNNKICFTNDGIILWS